MTGAHRNELVTPARGIVIAQHRRNVLEYGEQFLYSLTTGGLVATLLALVGAL